MTAQRDEFGERLRAGLFVERANCVGDDLDSFSGLKQPESG